MTEQLKPSTKGALTKLAAECHRAKWQFDFNDETRLPISQARDMVRRAFSELHRIGDTALRLRDSAASSTDQPVQAVNSYPEMRERTIEECALAAEAAKLPDDYQWGRDAMEQFNFGKRRAADAIRATKGRK